MSLGLGGYVLAPLFFKKTVFFLTTGTILFYLVSFSSIGHVPEDNASRKALLDCQEKVRVMNYGDLKNLRRDQEINYKNVLLLTKAEQKVVNAFLKENKSSLITNGSSSPVKVTTNIFESRTTKILGYKTAIYSPEDKAKIATYFTDTEGNILFTHWAGFMATKKWNCGNQLQLVSKLR